MPDDGMASRASEVADGLLHASLTLSPNEREVWLRAWSAKLADFAAAEIEPLRAALVYYAEPREYRAPAGSPLFSPPPIIVDGGIRARAALDELAAARAGAKGQQQ